MVRYGGDSMDTTFIILGIIIAGFILVSLLIQLMNKNDPSF